MGFLVFWIVMGVVVALIAAGKGRSGFGWFLYGVVIWPLALIHALILAPATPAAEDHAAAEGRIPCPYCAEMILPAATVCRFCHRDLQDAGPGGAAELQGDEDEDAAEAPRRIEGPLWEDPEAIGLVQGVSLPVVFDYVDFEGAPSTRSVNITRAFRRDDHLYFAGYDLHRSDMRTFRLDRANDVTDARTGEIYEDEALIAALVALAAKKDRRAGREEPGDLAAIEQPAAAAVAATSSPRRGRPSRGGRIAFAVIVLAAIGAVFAWSQRPTGLRLPGAADPAAVARPAGTGPTAPASVEPAAPPAAPIAREQVAVLQRLLSELGHDPGPADGILGARTADAIRAWQRAAGVPVDGRATRSLALQLRSDIERRRGR